MASGGANQDGQYADSLAQVLFLDVVDFTLSLPKEQVHITRQLEELVRPSVASFSADEIIILPRGDGLGVVFLDVQQPHSLVCAFEISERLRRRNSANGVKPFSVRMGIDLGPVFLTSMFGKPDAAGPTINRAYRIMNLGDENHILISNSALTWFRTSQVIPDGTWPLPLSPAFAKHSEKIEATLLWKCDSDGNVLAGTSSPPAKRAQAVFINSRKECYVHGKELVERAIKVYSMLCFEHERAPHSPDNADEEVVKIEREYLTALVDKSRQLAPRYRLFRLINPRVANCLVILEEFYANVGERVSVAKTLCNAVDILIGEEGPLGKEALITFPAGEGQDFIDQGILIQGNDEMVDSLLEWYNEILAPRPVEDGRKKWYEGRRGIREFIEKECRLRD